MNRPITMSCAAAKRQQSLPGPSWQRGLLWLRGEAKGRRGTQDIQERSCCSLEVETFNYHTQWHVHLAARGKSLPLLQQRMGKPYIFSPLKSQAYSQITQQESPGSYKTGKKQCATAPEVLHAFIRQDRTMMAPEPLSELCLQLKTHIAAKSSLSALYFQLFCSLP